eukprot:478740-Amphidinium_carterae.2
MASSGSAFTAGFGGCGRSAHGLSSADDAAASGNVFFSADGRPTAGEFRKEGKMQLPKLEVLGPGTGPSVVIRGFEVWALNTGLIISLWTRSPEVAHAWWQDCLAQATTMWQTWSVQSPAQRVQEMLVRDMPLYGFCPAPENAVEAVLRTCLQEVLPKNVVERCMV